MSRKIIAAKKIGMNAAYIFKTNSANSKELSTKNISLPQATGI